MFCANCGKELPDNAQFCANCGKPPKMAAVSNDTAALAGNNQTAVYVQNFNSPFGNIKPKHNYLLLGLTAKLFSLFLEISFWLLLLLGMIIGGVVGSGENGDSLAAIGGVIVGAIISFVIMVVVGGLFSKIIQINANIEEIKNRTK